jgi:predicted Zn-dependent peptidase
MSREILAVLALVALSSALALVGCGAAPDEQDHVHPGDGSGGENVAEVTPEVVTPRQPPPPSATPRDVHLPPIVRTSLRSGLELNTVRADRLPIVYVRLVIRSGLARSPEALPGLASFVGRMLKEGTTTRSSEQLADEIEYIGASLDVSESLDSISIQMRATSDQLDAVLDLMADLATRPAFAEDEITRVRALEADRLSVTYADPSSLARREFFRLAYGSHPYAHIDLEPTTLERLTRGDLVAWHRTHFVPSNAFLVVVGDVTPDQVRRSADRAFRGWRGAAVPALQFPEVPARAGREILLVHRPGSVQSVIAVGNLTIPRAHPDFVPLDVANQVLGGSAASRLFMDLRERRSLTYGAYSGIDELAGVSPFRARAAVPNARTAPAMDAFMEHLERIVREEAPAQEVEAAQRYLSDSFPLAIDTFGRIAGMVAELRLFQLPDDYWDTYRSQIRAVTPAQALAAAQAHIHPDRAVVVVVGDASVVAEPLSRWGEVRMVDTDGRPITLEAVRAAAGAAR